LWANDYSRGFAIRDEGRTVAVLVYVRVKCHRINFGRMTLRDYRGRGYARMLLAHLIKRFPRDTLECQNVNPKLTAGLERAGFTMVNESNRTFRLSRRR
jgi:GNAT superfamily N-acetyltransferase